MRALVLAVALAATPLAAEVRPVPTGGDPRIQTVTYDPQQVVQLQVATGYQLTLEFAPGERIETVAVGDSGAWDVTPGKSGDHLFVKVLQNGVTTNMTVVTDARTYAFVLAPAYGPTPDMAFTVRFAFPSPTTATATGALSQAAPEVGRYRLGGDRALRPRAMDDDGVRTFIEWNADQALPAVFALDERGRETLVNGMMRDRRYVIDSIANHFVFRIDRARATATRSPRRKGR